MNDLPLVLIAYALYWTSIRGEFMFDDNMAIGTNAAIMAGNIKNAKLSTWRQITLMSYAFNVWLFGPPSSDGKTHVGGFHAVNIAIHAFNAMLVRQILEVLTRDVLLAYAGALFFLCHSLAVTAVANISRRDAALSSTIAFMAVLCVVSGHAWATLILIPLAVLAKEDMVVLFVTIPAVLWAQGHSWALALPLLVVPFLYWKRSAIHDLFRMSGEKDLIACGFPPMLRQPQYGITAFTETVLRFPFWACGFWLNPDPEIKEVRWYSPRFLAALALFGGAVYLFTVGDFLTQLGLILICVSPLALYILTPIPDPVMEYRAYFSLLGLTILAVKGMMLVPWYIIVLGLLWFVLTSYHYASVWKSPKQMWLLAALRGGKARAWFNLAAAHITSQDFFVGEQYLRECVKVCPTLGPAWGNFGHIAKNKAALKMHAMQVAEAQGNKEEAEKLKGEIRKLWEEARDHFLLTTQKTPSYALAWPELAGMYENLGELKKAEECYRKAIEVDPIYHGAYHRLGMNLGLQDRWTEAIEPLKWAYERRVDMPNYRHSLAVAHWKIRNLEAARALFRNLPPGYQIPWECA